MRILVLGAGLQGRATLHDLSRSPEVTHVIAADADTGRLAPFMKHLDAGKVEPVTVDAGDLAAVGSLMHRVDAVVSLLPIRFHVPIARLAIESGLHYVNTSYAPPEFAALGEEVARRGLAILPEFGFDPGIDLALAGQAMRELDEVQEYYSYGTGFPEPAAANNVLRYKISWTFAGVLKAYCREARAIHDGQVVVIPGREMFAPQNIHMIDLEGYGPMEAYPNGDAVAFLDRMGITRSIQNAGRFATRWPGHCAYWYAMAQLGFLDDAPIQVDGAAVVPRDFVAALLEPQLQYAGDERDVAMLRVDVRGLKDGERRQVVYELTDVRDLETGLLAMNRTVGYTASIGVQMVLRGDITRRGLLSPLTDVPVDRLMAELTARGITIRRREGPC